MKTPAADRSLAAALQRLDARLDWERRDRRRMAVGLEPVRDLLARLGQPQQRLRVVHVAGTKGKGSVGALIAAALKTAGLRSAHYQSPHVLRLNERFVIDGAPVDDNQLAAALHTVLDCSDAARAESQAGAAADATHFDMLTAAAFELFARAGVQMAVIEVGLGGRQDSTNVVQPLAAVITHIGLEHTEVLGSTRAAIAWHKAGIVKAGAALVTAVPADDEAGPVIADEAQAAGVQPVWVTLPAQATLAERNTRLARAVLDVLGQRGEPVSAADLSDALAATVRLPARMQRLSGPQGVPLMVDGAHTRDALDAVLSDLARLPDWPRPPVVLLALAADKPAPALLGVLPGRIAALVCTTLAGARGGWPAESLAQEARTLGSMGDLHAAPGVADGLQLACRLAHTTGTGVLATGTLHLLPELLAVLPAQFDGAAPEGVVT